MEIAGQNRIPKSRRGILFMPSGALIYSWLLAEIEAICFALSPSSAYYLERIQPWIYQVEINRQNRSICNRINDSVFSTLYIVLVKKAFVIFWIIFYNFHIWDSLGARNTNLFILSRILTPLRELSFLSSFRRTKFNPACHTVL
jgi:hypothetical protein